MSDFMEYADYYKKAWEQSLSERTSELQEKVKSLEVENARYRKALDYIFTWAKGVESRSVAWDALNGRDYDPSMGE